MMLWATTLDSNLSWFGRAEIEWSCIILFVAGPKNCELQRCSMFPACAVILTRWTAVVLQDTNLPILSPCAKLPYFMQVLIRTLLDTVGAASAPIDSPALLNGLVDVQSAPQLMLLQKIPFHVPTYKVTVSLCAACKASFMQWILCHVAKRLPGFQRLAKQVKWLLGSSYCVQNSSRYRTGGVSCQWIYASVTVCPIMHHAAWLRSFFKHA